MLRARSNKISLCSKIIIKPLSIVTHPKHQTYQLTSNFCMKELFIEQEGQRNYKQGFFLNGWLRIIRRGIMLVVRLTLIQESIRVPVRKFKSCDPGHCK